MRGETWVSVAQRALLCIAITSRAQQLVSLLVKTSYCLDSPVTDVLSHTGQFQKQCKKCVKEDLITKNSLGIFLICKIEVYSRSWVSKSNPSHCPPHPHGTYIFLVKNTVLFYVWGCCISFLKKQLGNL